ncbi:carboxypeptidase-like regulatory domain-containing protein [Mesobacillus persicus]|nr:carboxypeptidase-like regulatory domain-containing protein [Mesobacillus persicus]
MAEGEADGKEKVLQALESPIFPEQRWNLIRRYMLDDGISNRFDVYVGPSSTQVNNQSLEMRFTWEEKFPYLQRYLESGPIDGYLTTTARQLSFYYQREDQLEKADEALRLASERYADSQYSSNKFELESERIKMFLKHADVEKARSLIDKAKEKLTQEDFHQIGALASLEAEVVIHERGLDEALDFTEKELEIYQQKYADEQRQFPDHLEGRPVALEQLESLKQHLESAVHQNSRGNTTVKGKVIRSDGKPVANAGVFLREEHSVHHSVFEDEPYQLVTDKEGNFEFSRVIPGSYQLYLGLNFDQIDGWTWPVQYDEWVEIDGQESETLEVTLHPLLELHGPVNQETVTTEEVKFAWEEVEGAASYDIHLSVNLESGSIGTTFKENVKGNQLTVSVEELYDQPVGIVFEDTEDWSSVDPVSILAFTNTENRFSWAVRAFDKNGEMITQSNGYRLDEETIGNLPFFYLKERELSEADQLFLDKKVEQAYQQYKEDYENDPNDRHSLRMIIRLIGAEASQSGHTRDEVALPYMIKWAEKSKSPEVAFDLAQHYYEKRAWKEYLYWYNRYVELNGGRSSDYVLGVHATALMKQGSLAQAKQAFNESLENDGGNRFIGSLLALELYDGESFEVVGKLAGKYPERVSSSGNTDWQGIIQEMSIEERKFDDYEKEIQQVLKLYFDDDHDRLNKWLETTNKPQLKQFLMALKETR